MKNELPLLFNALCNEVYSGLNIKDMSYPTWKHQYIYIYLLDGSEMWTTKSDLDGWLFNNKIILDIENIEETERKFKELELKNKIKY